MIRIYVLNRGSTRMSLDPQSRLLYIMMEYMTHKLVAVMVLQLATKWLQATWANRHLSHHHEIRI